MKKILFTALGAVLLFICSCRNSGQQDGQVKLAKPSDVQYKWQEQERTQYIVWDICTWQGREFDDHSTPLERINPTKLNTDQWCKLALSWGAKEILFIAKHTGGFCWWPSETTDYDISNTPYKNGKGDIVKELAESCKKFGLNLGIYVYPGDATWGAGLHGGGKTEDPSKQEAYNEVLRTQYKEILTQYGDIIEIWFDGGCVVDMSDVIEKYAQNTVIFQGPHATIRWPGSESGKVFYPAWNTVKSKDLKTGLATQAHDDPDGDAWAPLEANTTISHHNWFWSPEKYGKGRKSVSQLIDSYYQSIGYGCQLVLGVAPDTTGQIQPEDVALFKAFGEELDRRFKTPVCELKNKKGRTVTLKLPEPHTINHIITMEDYREGHRIRKYLIEGLSKGRWTRLAEGSSIGRKKIDYFDDIEVSKVRFTATEAVATPLIRSMAIYNVSNFTPPEKKDMKVWAVPSEVYTWEKGMLVEGQLEVEIDLSKKIKLPGQFILDIIPDSKEVPISIEKPEIYFEGEKAMEQFTSLQENNRLLINRTAMTDAQSKSVVKFTIKTNTPCSGKITFKPMLVYQ